MGGCIRKTHGMSDAPEYKAWKDMLRRCRNPKSHNWKYYGGRGIEVRFASFEEFFATVGPRPTSKHSIDRWPNNDSHYQSGNVRWATHSQQQRNRRNHLNLGGDCSHLDLGSEYCQRGHEFTPENTYLRKDGKRHCKECARLRDLKHGAIDRLNTAVRKYIKRFGGIIFLGGIPPFIPHDCMPKRWPATIETAVVVAQKVSAMQGRRCS
jgi:hypothetical protein